MSALLWVTFAMLVAAASGMAVGLARTRERGEQYEPRHLPRPAKPPAETRQDFYGSMSHEDEAAWARRWLPADPIPYGDLQSDARIEDRPDWREQTAADLAPEALHHDGEWAEHEWLAQHPEARGGDAVDPRWSSFRSLSEGTPVSSGPVVVPHESSTGPDSTCGGCGQPAHTCGGCSCPPGWCRCPDRCSCTRLADTGEIEAAGLGPRARAVLERYERGHRERWAIA